MTAAPPQHLQRFEAELLVNLRSLKGQPAPIKLTPDVLPPTPPIPGCPYAGGSVPKDDL